MRMSSRRVLVLDDDAQVRRALVRMLRSWEVTDVGTAAEAVERLEAGDDFGVLLIDQTLRWPCPRGLDLCATVQQRFPVLADRLVLLTGGLQESEWAEARRLGVTVMMKPPSLKELRELVSSRCAGAEGEAAPS
jgi:CheY-like chemotaxis protein